MEDPGGPQSMGKKNEILPLAKIWMDSEGVILSQQLATFMAPGTGFLEDNFFIGQGGGMGDLG